MKMVVFPPKKFAQVPYCQLADGQMEIFGSQRWTRKWTHFI